jgi:D-methionine transport system ATP-binding protein
VINIRDLRKIFGKGDRQFAALDGINLDVESGEIFGVLGQSGAGKSTLIRCVNRLETPTSGVVLVDGEEITALSNTRLRQARQRIGMIFQHFNLLSSRTAAENIAFPLEVMGEPRLKRKARVEELLSLVGLEGRGDSYPSQLSGGQKQRVGIARSLAVNPRVLLSDEATSALDPQTTRSILDLLRELQGRMGLTILLITHDMNVVKQVCDRVAILQAGQIVEQGRVADLAAQPTSLLAQEFFPRPQRQPRSNGILATIAFSGAANQSILTTLIRRFNVDVNILNGSVETVGNQRVGQFQVELAGAEINAALHYLHQQELGLEVQS